MLGIFKAYLKAVLPHYTERVHIGQSSLIADLKRRLVIRAVSELLKPNTITQRETIHCITYVSVRSTPDLYNLSRMALILCLAF